MRKAEYVVARHHAIVPGELSMWPLEVADRSEVTQLLVEFMVQDEGGRPSTRGSCAASRTDALVDYRARPKQAAALFGSAHRPTQVLNQQRVLSNLSEYVTGNCAK